MWIQTITHKFPRKPWMLGVLMALGSGVLQAAEIKVTTTADENGENSSACSLREAIRANNTRQPYGGCTPGKWSENNTIQLAANATYQVNSELTLERGTAIYGSQTDNNYKRDPITNEVPRRSAITSKIVGPSNARLFNSSVSRADLTLRDIDVSGGSAAYGGLFLMGGALQLTHTRVRNAQASQAGGAVYLSGVDGDLTATDTVFEGNQAPTGSVVAMSCIDSLQYTPHTINLTTSSVYDNGDSASASVFELCGKPTASFSVVTLGQNTTRTDGAVITMTNNASGSRLGTGNTLQLNSVSLVKNSGGGLAYSDPATLSVGNSIIGFNGGRDCTQVGGNEKKAASVNVLYTNPSQCDFVLASALPANNSTLDQQADGYSGKLQDAYEKYLGTSKIRSISGAFDTYFRPSLANYGYDIPGFMPQYSSGGANPLINTGAVNNECGARDQRGVRRTSRLNVEKTSDIECDVGALEYAFLTAEVNGQQENQSYVNLTTVYQSGLSSTQLSQLSSTEQGYISDAERQSQSNVNEIKRVDAYRMSVVDVLAKDVPASKSDGTVADLYGEGYTVTAQAIGTVEVNSSSGLPTRNASGQIISRNSSVIRCEWNNQLKHLLIWRSDGNQTASGDAEACEYTVTYTPTGARSTNYAMAQIVNIAPVANNDSYTRQYTSGSSISLDLLSNDSDEGDGATSARDYPTETNANGQTVQRPQFYDKGPNIRIVIPPSGGTIQAEVTGPCPDNKFNNVEKTCYGGKMTYVPNNSYSPFNDSFTYVVLDSDLRASNEATVQITNTATTTDNVPRNGGALTWGAVAVLGLLALARRRFYA